MPGSGPPVYYWDTCIFLAWLKNEQRPAGEMDGVSAAIERFNRGRIRLMTSVLTYTEATIAKLPAGVDRLLEDAMQRPNMAKVGVDIKIAKLARDIRNHYLGTSIDGFTVSVPDSIHLATAILYRADEFHTFDTRDQQKYRSLGLLPLNGDVAGHRIRICKPSTQQLELVYPETIDDAADSDTEENDADEADDDGRAF